VDRTKINDRSGASVDGAAGSGAGAAAASAGPGGVPNALAAALQKIKDKASKSGKFLLFCSLLSMSNDFVYTNFGFSYR
jgi:hypothetical protein